MEVLLLEAGGGAQVRGGDERAVEVIRPLMVRADDHASAGDAARQDHAHRFRLRRASAQARPAMPAHIVESPQMTFAIADQQNAFAEHLEYQMIARIGQFLFTASRNPLAAEYVLLFGAEYLRAAIPAGGQSGFQLCGVHSGKSR